MPDCTCPAHALAASRRFLCAEDVDTIHMLTQALPAEREVTVVDLGAGSGTTALAVFAARPERVRVVTVDNDQANLDWASLAVRNVGQEHHWTPMRRDAGEPFIVDAGLLLHDAGHTEGDVERDLRAWLPRLRVGTPIWVHDYGVHHKASTMPDERYPGVARAVQRLIREGMLAQDGTAGWGWYGRAI